MVPRLCFVCACYIFIGNYIQTASANNGRTKKSVESVVGRVDEDRLQIIENPAIAKYPYFAVLDICGAAIISETWIITAAHCVLKDTHIPYLFPKTVCVGGTATDDCIQYTYDQIVIHPGFEGFGAIRDDIALLELTQGLVFSDEIQPIQLPKMQFTSGWLTLVTKRRDENGYVSKEVDPRVHVGYNDDSCRERGYGEAFCAIRDKYQAGTCSGDSGSPMVRGRILVGIVSAIGDQGRDCNENMNSYAVNVAYYVPWIKSVTGIN